MCGYIALKVQLHLPATAQNSAPVSISPPPPPATTPAPPTTTPAPPTTTPAPDNSIPALTGFATPSDTFTEAEIRAHLGLDGLPVDLRLDGLPADFDEFDFPEHLMAGLAKDPLVLDGTSFPTALPATNLNQFAIPLSPELLMQLEGMPSEARASRKEELMKMDAETLGRENNAARNRYMLNGLGLGDAAKETLWGGTKAPPPQKRKAEGNGGGGGKKKQRKRKDPVVETSEEEDNEESQSEEEESTGTKTNPTKAKTRRDVPAAVRASEETEPEIPPWAETALEFLTQPDLGDGWKAMLSTWWARETRARFVGTKQGHPAKRRPKEIGEWSKRARNYTPKIVDADAFGQTLWIWWIDINPSWRGSERPLSRVGDVDGGWECLDLYGVNGFLNVLMGLKWWRNAMSDASPDWAEAVDDVTWALSSMER
ncbi:hypothetical protein R3P38DRAFT_2504189 [Favolaschia claudopus]|uniref:Uncharacterized protein n=1 Tax=Favolaschia claudopus TaxID=2862362 RepID=A0AAW0DFM2_9AGAR